MVTASDGCAGAPCKNGDCSPINGGFECCCDEGWTGRLCDVGKDVVGYSSLTSFTHDLSIAVELA